MKKFVLLSCLITICVINSYSQIKVANGNNVYVNYVSSTSGSTTTYSMFNIGPEYVVATNPSTGQPVYSVPATWAWGMDSNKNLRLGVPSSNTGLSSAALCMKFEGFTSYPKVGIGKTPTFTGGVGGLDVNGNIMYSGSLLTSSDVRLKSEINNIPIDVVNDLYKLHGLSYNKSLPESEVKTDFEEKHPEPIKEYGFLAQDVQKLFPDLVSEDENGYLSVNYIALIPLLVEALKIQQMEIKELQTQLQVAR